MPLVDVIGLQLLFGEQDDARMPFLLCPGTGHDLLGRECARLRKEYKHTKASVGKSISDLCKMLRILDGDGASSCFTLTDNDLRAVRHLVGIASCDDNKVSFAGLDRCCSRRKLKTGSVEHLVE